LTSESALAEFISLASRSELAERVRNLKKQKAALLLCHNYQRVEVQKVSDHVGDSLELCLAATKASGFEEIVFCGVDFMAESAAALNPGRRVLIPSHSATCDMAAMLRAEQVGRAKKEHPDAAVVLYINSLAEAKAEADVLCTSANAVEIVSKVDADEVLFGPDRNLGLYVSGRVPAKTIIHLPSDGCCYVHKMIRPEHVLKARADHPRAEILVHPECDPDVVKLADFTVSTGGMVRRAVESSATEFVIGTEATMAQTLAARFPRKRFHPILESALCRSMQETDLGKLALSLERDIFEVKVSRRIAEGVRRVTQRMLDLTG